MLRPQRFGRYILLDRLSAGGMAEVFLAKSSGLQGFEKILAIKRILPAVSEDSDFTTMFIDEAKISANLSHAHIGQVFEFGQVGGQYYIALEYIPGRDLRAIYNHLADTGRLMPLGVALHIGTRICQALDYAHRQKSPDGLSMEIVHRDVSPPNVILAFDGTVKLIDFGIAKAASRATRTRAGKLKGKFSYMSPEQVQGMPVDRRSDIFSLGVLLHEMLTARRLFHGENQLATLNLVRRAEVSPPSTLNPEIPLEVDRIVLKALARDRDQRYGWATELRADLERYLARTSTVCEPQQVAEWMRGEFAGEIEAERRMRERISDIRFEDVPEVGSPAGAGLPLEQAASQAGAVEARPGSGAPPLPATVSVSSGAGRGQPDQDDSSYTAPGPADYRAVVARTATPRPMMISPPLLVGPLGRPATVPLVPDEEPSNDAATVVHLAHSGENRLAHSDSLERFDQERAPVADLAAGLPPAERTDEVLAETVDEPVLMEAPDSSPLVFGPETEKQDDELAHISTAFYASYQDQPAPELADDQGSESVHPGPIAPGPDRDGATVRGALESGGGQAPEVLVEAAVDLTGLGALPVEVRRSAQRELTSPSGTRQVGVPGWPGLKVALLAGAATLVVAALVFSLLTLTRSDPGGQTSGSVVVTTAPSAACSVALALTPKGLLQPGSSLTLGGITPGRHLITLQCVGFRPYATTVEVKPTQASFVLAPLQKNP